MARKEGKPLARQVPRTHAKQPPTLIPPGLDQMPQDVRQLMAKLHHAGYGVWLVGGAIRDMLLGQPPHDWDLATDAPVEHVAGLFEHVVPVGLQHGTVQILTGRRAVEVTVCPQRGLEGLLLDLARRDFTINALALSYPAGEVWDPHGGKKDLAARRLRAVGSARDRFLADPLRILRLPRLISQYGFRVHRDTLRAAGPEAHRLQEVAAERIRDELLKLVTGAHVLDGFTILKRTGGLQQVLPELLEGMRKKQNHFHRYDIYHHILHAVAASPERERVRLAALFHDIAKPRTRFKKDGIYRFYGHDVLGAEMAGQILQRWRLPKKTMAEVQTLIRNHMLIETDRWKDAAVRRLIARTGIDLIPDLLDLARADRSTHTEADLLLPELDRLEARIQDQLQQRVPLAVMDLAISGRDVMSVLKIAPGPRVGSLLNEAREWVLQAPENNRRERLLEWLREQSSAD